MASTSRSITIPESRTAGCCDRLMPAARGCFWPKPAGHDRWRSIIGPHERQENGMSSGSRHALRHVLGRASLLLLVLAVATASSLAGNQSGSANQRSYRAWSGYGGG